MPFGPQSTSDFDGWALGRALKSLLKIKGAQEIPPSMNVEALQPTVDVAQSGFAQYERVGKATNTALTAGNNQQVIILAQPDPTSSGVLDTRDVETLVFGLNWQYVQGALRANDNLGYILEMGFYNDAGQPSAKLARSYYKYKTTGTDSAYDFGFFGEFEDGINPGSNQNVPPQYGNRMWIPNMATLQLVIYNTVNFQVNDLVYHNIIGVQVPKNTPVPQW